VDDMNLPTAPVESAQLPALYESAKIALSECSRIDECQQWADKAAAMASYAKQSKDETLHRYADRIKARAITRCGELLKAIQPANGANQNIKEGALPNVTREQAAADAGLSEHQRKTALRVANVDPEVREALIESDNPPTITALADLGKKPRNIVDLGDINPRDYALATTAIGTLRDYAAYCKANDAIRIAGAIQPHEVAAVRRYVATVDAWHDSFVVHLEG
jgi:hypothetical protein